MEKSHVVRKMLLSCFDDTPPREVDLVFNKEKKIFSQEASSLGFAPGEWPNRVLLIDLETGERRGFQYHGKLERGEELYYVTYCTPYYPDHQEMLTLKIFND